MNEHPVQLVVEDDLLRTGSRSSSGCSSRSRISSGCSSGRSPSSSRRSPTGSPRSRPGRRRRGCTGFMCEYIRYVAHLNAYLWLVANPYPGFVGEEGEYPVDIELPAAGAAGPPEDARPDLLAIPALLLSAALGGARLGPDSGDRGTYGRYGRRRRRRARGRLRGPRLVRRPRARPDAEGPPRRRRATASATARRCSRTSCSSPTATRTRTRRRCSSRFARPPQHPVYLVGDAHDLRHSRVTRLLPAAACDPASRLARALDDRGRDRRLAQLVRDALHRHAAARLPPLPLRVRAVLAPRLAVHLSRGEPVPGLHRRAGPLSARRRAPRARSGRTAG